MTKTEITPLYDRVLIKKIEEESVSKGGIYIPESAKEKPMRGEVLSVGAGHRLDNGQLGPMTVKVGDTVLFGKYAGSMIRYQDQELLTLKEEDIFAILREYEAE